MTLTRRDLLSILPTSAIISQTSIANDKNPDVSNISDIRVVNVNDFGADPTGKTDSTLSVLKAIYHLVNSYNSCFSYDNKKYGKVIFGSGIYIVSDIPIITGVYIEGQGRLSTLIKPRQDAKYCFTTNGTSDYYQGGIGKRLMDSGLSNFTISPGRYDTSEVKSKSGGINIEYASYVLLENICVDGLFGCGLHLAQVWDSDFYNVRITACGNNNDNKLIIPGLAIMRGVNPGDGCNALRFHALHIENCTKLLEIDLKSRHIFFISPKLEGTVSKESSTIRGSTGINFSNAELTWQYSDKPMFEIKGEDITSDNKGVIFSSPSIISAPDVVQHGWYFAHESKIGFLNINNCYSENVKTLAVGNNILIKEGSSYNCGPTFLDFHGGSECHGFRFTNPLSVNDDYSKFIRINGEYNKVTNLYIQGVNGMKSIDNFLSKDKEVRHFWSEGNIIVSMNNE